MSGKKGDKVSHPVTATVLQRCVGLVEYKSFAAAIRHDDQRRILLCEGESARGGGLDWLR